MRTQCPGISTIVGVVVMLWAATQTHAAEPDWKAVDEQPEVIR